MIAIKKLLLFVLIVLFNIKRNVFPQNTECIWYKTIRDSEDYTNDENEQ